jgi:hypothetical protein
VEAHLPSETFDPRWLRDGIVEKSPDTSGRRQWWLSQMLRMVPPSHWSTKWELTPDECFEAASGDFAKLIETAWSDAAELHNDVPWMRVAALRSIDDSTRSVRVSILQHLPAEYLRRVLEKIFTSSRLDWQLLNRVLSELKTPLDAQLSDQAIVAVERVRDNTSRGYDYTLPSLLEPLSHQLWPGTFDALAVRWGGEAWESNRKTLDSFFQTLRLRQGIQTEFRS